MSEITDSEARIVRMALAWYRTKTPMDWTFDQHDSNPQVNCVGEKERALAEAVRDWLIES